MLHKAGFVNIIGNPNVGKSTLMNILVGEKLSIITYKAQTTRHRILGVVNGKDYQVVFSDTPGMIAPHYKLHQVMMRQVESAFQDADILLLILEVNEGLPQQELIDKINETAVPLIVVINKIDLGSQQIVEEKFAALQSIFPDADVIPISALKNVNVSVVFDKILKKLPENPPFYEKDTLTDRTERFFVSEIIREKILLNYKKEIPYSVEVAVDQFKESEDLVRISTIVFTARETQKAILLGHQGNAIKKVGTQARLELEKWLGKKVFLEITIKVSKDWRDNDQQLKRFGYE
jgi:GTPase